MTELTVTLVEIENALKNDEFIFYYQPKISMITGALIGAEALIRWQKPDGELVMPTDFLPLAESSGFICEITKLMFKKLNVDMTIFSDIEGDFTVSINASSKDFYDSEFIDLIQRAIETKQVNPHSIEIELTESSLLGDSDVINENFEALVDMDVSLVMDDFGTGFSSIDMLSQFSFSTIKLDQGVVSRMDSSDKNRTIVESTIRMGHRLGLEVVAEGIETEDAYLALQNQGCTIAQGFWISRPLPIFDFLEFVRQKKRWPSTPIGLLYMAQLDHIHWRKSIIDSVFFLHNRKGGNSEIRGKPASNCKSCMLGKWYYGVGREFAGISAYDQLEAPHMALHKLGNTLLAAVEAGSKKEDLVEMMQELSRLSGQMIELLQDIENEIL